MDDQIFVGFGVEVLRRGKRFFIKYDMGEIVAQIQEIEITEAEAAKAQKKSERCI
jgi:hypothetical protein